MNRMLLLRTVRNVALIKSAVNLHFFSAITMKTNVQNVVKKLCCIKFLILILDGEHEITVPT